MKAKLNQRLLKIAELVPINASIIDVGCDHALLSIYISQNKKPKKVIASDIDTIIISGMGGLNMIGILKYSKDTYKNVNRIILSPNSDTYSVRKEIAKLGFMIQEEMLVKENNIIYPIIVFERGKKKYHDKDYLFGPILLEKKDTLFLEYIKKEAIKKEKLLEVLPKKYIKKRLELKKELHLISKIM